MVKLFLIGALLAAANAQNPQFEVASIKYNKAPNGDGSFTISPERLTANNTFLGVLIMRAYQIDQSQFPKLSDRLLDRYDVDAQFCRSGRGERCVLPGVPKADRAKMPHCGLELEKLALLAQRNQQVSEANSPSPPASIKKSKLPKKALRTKEYVKSLVKAGRAS